jgi:dTDP-4-dehydrorhamnose 3,5-epimerase
MSICRRCGTHRSMLLCQVWPPVVHLSWNGARHGANLQESWHSCQTMVPSARRCCRSCREICVNVQELAIPGLKLITPIIHRDDRGVFVEAFRHACFVAVGIPAEFVQDNHSRSTRVGTIRGLHFQKAPHAQGKLVRVSRGAVLDVAVDLRFGSPTFGRHVVTTLTADNWAQLWVPAGFAHGFCTLEPDTDVIYKVTTGYAPDCDAGLLWDDPALGIAWPVKRSAAVLSDKDKRQPTLAELKPFLIENPAIIGQG